MRESEDGRATFDGLTKDDWERFGRGEILDDAELNDVDLKSRVTPYLLFIDGKYVPPYLDLSFIGDMEVLMHLGAKKYSRDNWRKGCPRWRAFNSLIRHSVQALFEKDAEKKRWHSAAVGINAMFMWGGIE